MKMPDSPAVKSGSLPNRMVGGRMPPPEMVYGSSIAADAL
jgi:hypothetical protein